ncbi:hypothetical protein GcM3_090024, partial [Golovinomyces cichoracearum]
HLAIRNALSPSNRAVEYTSTQWSILSYIKNQLHRKIFITSLTKINFKTPDETTIIRYLSTAAISSAAVSLIDADTIAKATINDLGQATAAQLNAYALLRIMDYKTNPSTYSDLNLLYAFKEDFEQWTTSEFKALDSRIRRELRQALSRLDQTRGSTQTIQASEGNDIDTKDPNTSIPSAPLIKAIGTSRITHKQSSNEDSDDPSSIDSKEYRTIPPKHVSNQPLDAAKVTTFVRI